MNKKQQFAMAGARNGDRGAMTFRRSPAGNHVEPRARDKWERQAEEAAHRILRGERNVARMLTPAPAASLTVPLSRGEPLPGMLREQMEEGFGADLSAVRVHRDQHAAAEARLQHASAFTTGRDLFFGDAWWSPWTGRGRELIAHEIAHALQQTGRSASDRKSRATETSGGSGTIQCKDEPGGIGAGAQPTQEELKTQGAIFEAVAGLYRDGEKKSNDRELEDVIDKVGDLLGNRLIADASKPDFAAPLGNAATRGEFAKLKSPRAKSFVFECLKALGYFGQAGRILESDKKFEMRVLGTSGPFLTFLKDSPDFGLKWISQFMSHRDFAPFWPSVIVHHWRNFFLRPQFIDPPDHALQQRLESNWKEVSSSQTVFRRTEQYYLAWLTISDLYRESIDDTIDLRMRLLSLTGKARGLRAALVEEMPALRNQEEAYIDTEGVSPAERRIAKEKIGIIDELLPFWQQVLAEYSTWRAKFLSLSPAELGLGKAIQGLPDGSSIAPLLQPFRKPLVGATSALFAPITVTQPGDEAADAGTVRLPTITEYTGRLRTFVHALIVQTSTGKSGEKLTWSDQVDALLVEQANKRKADAKTKLSLAMLPLIVGSLLDDVAKYDPKKDAESPSFEDMRAAHRFRIAIDIAAISRWLHWNDLLATVRDVLTGTEDKSIAAEDRQAELWLVSDWEPDEIQDVGYLGDDFPESLDKPVLRETPVTVRHIIEWFRYSQAQSLRTTLVDLLLVEDSLTAQTDLDTGRINKLRQTRKEVAESMAPSAEAELAMADANAKKFPITIPQRFIVRDWGVRIPPGTTFDWEKLITRHKKTGQQISRRAAGTIFPTDPAQGVFCWALPPLDGLIAFMKRIPVITALARNSRLEGADWLAQLAPDRSSSGDFTAEDAKKIHLSSEDWARLNEVLLLWLKRFRDVEEKQLPPLWRRLAILYRRSRVLRLRERIDTFAKSSLVTSGSPFEAGRDIARRLKIPDDVVQAVFKFEPAVRGMLRDAKDPDAAAEVQTALFILGLAPSLLAIDLRDVDGYFKSHLFAFYTLAIDYATDAEKLKRLREGTGSPDEVNGLVYSKTRLEEIVAGMKQAIAAISEEWAAVQQEAGFRSEDGKTIQLNTRRLPEKIEPKQEWTGGALGNKGLLEQGSGVKYNLLKVFRTFEFHPQAGSAPPKNMRAGAGGPYKPSFLKYSEGGEQVTVYELDKHPELKEVPLFKIEINGYEQTVTAFDVQWLEDLSFAFLRRVFQIGMANLGELIKTFDDYMKLVVTIVFPELGLPVMVADIAQMFLSGEFDDLIEQLSKDPFELIGKLASELRDKLFAPENIWKFIILGAQTSPWHTLTGLLPKRAPKVHPPPTTKFGKVVAALRSLGSRFNRVLHRVREYTQPPLRSVQGRIAMHPTVVWLLYKAIHLGETAFDLIPFDKLEEARKSDSSTKDSTASDLFRLNAADAEEELSSRVAELFEGIRHVELPGELINLAVASEIIVDFILSRFGPRGKIARIALEACPVPESWKGHGRGGGVIRAMDFITFEIARVWRDTAVDPNKYWQRDVMPIIADKFGEVRDDLVDGMYSVTDDALHALDLPPLKKPEKEALPKTEVVPDDLEEGNAALSRDEYRPGVVEFPSTGGRPLSQDQRARFEPALGADLSHVRLHAGTPQATSAVGADAMTSGSHVYMRPGIPPESNQGTHLLAHELTHVVQQTGAGDAGAPGHRDPSPGRAGLGIRQDPARESIAECISERVAGGSEVPSGLRAQIGSAAGAQPSMPENVVEGVLEVMTKRVKREEFEKDLEGGDPPGWSDAQSLISALQARLNSPEKIKFAAFLRDTVDGTKISEKVTEYITKPNPFGDMKAMKKVAMLGQKPIKKKSKDDPDTELDPKRFLQLLANYLYAERAAGIKITIAKNPRDVSEVEIFNLDMAGIGGGAALWGLAMKASFGGNPDVPDLKKAQADIRERLQSRRGQPSVWDSRNFKFAAWFINDYIALVKARSAAKVTEVPEVSKYINTKSDRGDVLAVATHGQLTSGRGIGAFGRESHHTTQYLLIEFFSNNAEASRKAFPDVGDFTLAGIRPAGDEVAEIKGPGGSIKVAELNPNSNRGAEMPAILLSARCHQKGELHVLRESRWVDDAAQDMERKGTMTQGLAIENRFNSAIQESVLRPRETSQEKRAALRARIRQDPVSASQQYYRAALATYKWMHDRMIPQLKHGLLGEEKAYYRGIAAETRKIPDKDDLQPAWNLEDSHLLHVYDVAAKNNDEVMQKYGWKI